MAQRLSQFPPIPLDIERLIFESAAEEDRKTALSLVLVSHRSQQWIDPILYRVVALFSADRAEIFTNTIKTSQKAPRFFATHVKFLVFNHTVHFRHLNPVLDICTGIFSLGCWLNISRGQSSELTAILNSGVLRPQRLAAPLPQILSNPDPDFRLPIFQNLTHLKLLDMMLTSNTWSWTGLRMLEKLTHLAVERGIGDLAEIPVEFVRNVLFHSPRSLRVFIVFTDFLHDGSVTMAQMRRGDIDHRLVLGTHRRLICVPFDGQLLVYNDYKPWGYPHLGRPDYWECAEEIIKIRKSRLTTCHHERKGKIGKSSS